MCALLEDLREDSWLESTAHLQDPTAGSMFESSLVAIGLVAPLRLLRWVPLHALGDLSLVVVPTRTSLVVVAAEAPRFLRGRLHEDQQPLPMAGDR